MRIVVIGGGIAGLTAAWEVSQRHPGAQVVVLEADDRLGGKLRAEQVAGMVVDVGAEAMLARRPEGIGLAADLGLSVVHPTAATSRLYSRGELRPLPRSMMGVPTDLTGLQASGVLSDEALARVRREPDLPLGVIEDDMAVGDLIDRHFGTEVTDRLVEPLLGGVYAGHAREISARAAAPQLLAMAARGSLLEQASQLGEASAQATVDQPVFASVAGGMHRLPEALAEHLRSNGHAVHTGAAVTSLRQGDTGTFEVATDGDRYDGDAVIVATPARVSARLLRDLAPEASHTLDRFEAASVGVITLALRADEALAVLGEDRSGLLVPPIEKRRIKAATFSFAKWAQVREAGRGAGPDGEDLVVLRTSVGRHRDGALVGLSDAELIGLSMQELADLTGLEAEVVDAHVQRWHDGLPQYPVHHLTAVAAVRHAVAQVPGLAVCGAAYDGVGVPATIGSAVRAVADLRAAWDRQAQ